MQTIIVANSILVPDLFAKTCKKTSSGSALDSSELLSSLTKTQRKQMFEDLDLDTILKAT